MAESRRRIICAVDFSRPSQAAYARALAISRDRRAELTVVHAVPAAERFNWQARARIDRTAELRAAADAAGVPVRISEQHGDPTGVILLHANAGRFDLIVLGHHAAGDGEHGRSTGVAERVIERTRCPVLVVPASETRSDGPASPPHIVCPVNFTSASDVAVEHALRLVQRGGDLTLLHVARPSRHEYPFNIPARERWLLLDARERLQDAIPIDSRAAATVRARVVSGRPAAEITRLASELAADLIVMGVTARGPIGRTLMGSTTGRVIRAADRPVLAVPECCQSNADLEAAIGLAA